MKKSELIEENQNLKLKVFDLEEKIKNNKKLINRLLNLIYELSKKQNNYRYYYKIIKGTETYYTKCSAYEFFVKIGECLKNENLHLISKDEKIITKRTTAIVSTFYDKKYTFITFVTLECNNGYHFK